MRLAVIANPAHHEFQNENAAHALLERFQRVRRHTDRLVAPLAYEDQAVQSMPDASPAKWHRAHTTWFWETFVLAAYLPGYQPFDPAYAYLFNSYYEALGPRHPRPQRGLLTRPSALEIGTYRQYVDAQMEQLLRTASAAQIAEITPLIELGLAHEEQHQELLLMDVLHLFAQSPLKPAYRPGWIAQGHGRAGRFRSHSGGLLEIGDGSADAFAFDNERPRHKTWIEPFEISDRLVTNREWLAFMEDGGYTGASLWLSDGWAMVRAEGWSAPLYWSPSENGIGWQQMTLAGLRAVDPDAPVTHVSYYEAAAFAAWSGARLPTEAEWEVAAHAGLLEQTDDVAWQWTQSAYGAYPGFHASDDAVGEYNGKFMSGQMVLRGGASVTPPGHTRVSYRNFFRPEQRWMFSGLRLARDASARDTRNVGEDRAPARAKPRSVDVTRGDSPDEFERDVLAGLSAVPKNLSPKYFYDATGSALFEAICTTPEYYPTRTETELLKQIAPALSAAIADDAVLIEFGSGAGEKTRIVLDAAPQIAAYVPIDISPDALRDAAGRLAGHYPTLRITPLEADFTQAVQLPESTAGKPHVGFFPGSTIGNFRRDEAIAFLRSARRLLGAQSRLIVGADIVKDPATLIAAYDDAQGVTARFNKNLLVRINRELGGDFDLESFDHLAVWNALENRIEMHLVSRIDQIVHVAGRAFTFVAGERFHTENSHKFSVESFSGMATEAGWTVERHWVSPAPQFAVFELAAAEHS